jgi:hypothetical protein
MVVRYGVCAFVAVIALTACGQDARSSSASGHAGEGSGGGASSAGAAAGDGGARSSGGVTGGGVTAGDENGGSGVVGDGGGGSDGDRPLGTIPSEHATWSFPSGDPLNPTPPLLAAAADGIIIAGATSDPTLAGVSAFDAGVLGEAFVAKLDHQGHVVFSVRLADAGMPRAVNVSPTGEIVVIAPFLPDVPVITPGLYGNSGYLAKIAANGELLYERELPFDDGTVLYSLAIDADGAIYVSGAQYPADSFPNQAVLLAKYDADGGAVWTKVFDDAGLTAHAAAVAIAPNGDPLIAGVFSASMDLGGVELVTEALQGDSLMPNGFMARFKPDGAHVASERFGGVVSDGATLLTPLDNGDLILGGWLSGIASVGGRSVTADESDGSAFIARIDSDGAARWITLPEASGRAYAVANDPSGRYLHVVGAFSDGTFLVELDDDGKTRSVATLQSGEVRPVSVAVDARSSVWVSGSFSGTADFGNGNQLQAGATGMFLVRLDREESPPF